MGVVEHLKQVDGEKTSYQLESWGERSIEIDDIMDAATIYSSEGFYQMLDYSREDITYDDIRDDIDKLDMPDNCREVYKTFADIVFCPVPTKRTT